MAACIVDEASSASRTLTSAAREARVALLAGGRVGRDILRMPAYQIPPLSGVGEGGDTETLAGLYEWAAKCEEIAMRRTWTLTRPFV